MKKIISLLLSVIIVASMFFIPIDVQAKTLGDLKKELDELEANMGEAEGNKELTEAQIATIKKNILNIQTTVAKAQEEIISLNEDIELKNKQIAEKDKEIKEIINFVQVSNGESAYMEYAFGAQDFTDFIYRVAVAEQLADYNDSLIEQYNAMIEENKEKQEELRQKNITLAAEEKNLKVEVEKLGDKLEGIVDITVSLAEDIKKQREVIKLYEDLGCENDDDIEVCGRDKLPPDTAFYRPMVKGHVTSEYGNRCYWLNGKWTCDFHSGIDFSVGGKNIPVYSVAAGVVVATTYRASCGGNKVYVHHNINGKTYTSVYMHLRKMNVKEGDVVTKDTQIGIMGGNPYTEWWDRCSTGDHLHVAMATGLYYKDYYQWSTFIKRSVNARTIMNIPSGSKYFYDRYTRY